MKTFAFLLVATALATPALAQDTPRVTIPDVGHVTRPDTGYVTVPNQQQVTVPDRPQATVPDTPRAAQPAPPPPAERRPMPTRNVKVDVTITEEAGTGAPVKKVVSLVVADGRSSGVRSMANVPLATGPYRELPLHVDASVNVTSEQRVLLELRFNYTSVSVMTPIAAEGMHAPTTTTQQDMRAPKPGFSSINDSLVLLLTPGTPVIAARSADAASDRIVTVEVKAEILK